MNCKSLILLICILFCSKASFASQEVTFKWLGTSGFALSDGKTTLIFDPAMTRVSVLDLLPFRTVKSDSEEVDYWWKRCGLGAIQGVFVNHAHFDHVIDAPYITKKYGGKMFGSSSVVNVGLGQGLTSDQVQQIHPGEKWKIGDFTVTPFDTPHAPHFLGFTFMDGPIAKPLPSPSSVWNYRTGDTYSFLIEHPSGRILFQSVSRIYANDILKNMKVDALFLTIANRPNSGDLLKWRVLASGAKTVIPLHHDDFFLPLQREGPIHELWGVDTVEFDEKFNSLPDNLRPKLVWPKYCESVKVF